MNIMDQACLAVYSWIGYWQGRYPKNFEVDRLVEELLHIFDHDTDPRVD
jgi:hypothetical protein